jgi:multimeric flavodoxin WrbA
VKVVGIVGSPRKKGNTEFLVGHALKSIAEEGLETELIPLAGLDIRPCTACMACQKEERCSIDDDLFPIYLKMKAADGIIIASPVYYGSATALVKGLMERTGFISRHNGEVFSHKVGGPIAVARRAGQNFTLAQLTFWFQILGFFTPGSTYWNMAVGREREEVERDEEGLRIVWTFGKNMALLIKKLNS